MTITQLGPITQLAFVPADFDAAVTHWTRVMGVGPFFHLQHLAPPAIWYRCAPTRFDFSIALAYWGDIQIELVQQHDEVPSIYTDWSRTGRTGLHHVCQMVDDIANARRVLADCGATIVQEIAMEGGHALYAETEGEVSPLVEVIQAPADLLALFATIRSAAQDWDGSDPLRTL